MSGLRKVQVSTGVFWVEVPEAELYILCGAPADSLKHLSRKGFIQKKVEQGTAFETGPTAILLSDILIQNGAFSNLSEFPVLQMLYKQGMLIPNHPNNNGRKPLLIGSRQQINSQKKYIYRGNYGLVTEQELMHAGVNRAMIPQIMQMKLRFAFGKIYESEQFLDELAVEDSAVEIRSGVFIQRLRLNIFEISHEDRSVTVDLNLGPRESYQPPYSLGFHNIRREYFGVIHSGDGDGWDENRPAMSGILMFQGRNYLIDAGPNILHSLRALSIGVNEIEGIFHTHSHDDHFCGLPALMQSDRQIKYFASPMVIASVKKKLAALTSSEEDDFYNYFRVVELNEETWNDIDGFEVMPMYSPHPVETDVFLFRAMSADGFKTYAHFADTISFDTLKGMIATESEPGISEELYETTVSRYLHRADLKKIDVGGGMIHGNAEDFKRDGSGKIILSHTSQELTARQKEIGSGAQFGMVDVLIRSRTDYLRDCTLEILGSYFPKAPRDQLEILLNCPFTVFNPGTILLKAGVVSASIFLILSGHVEMINTRSGIHNFLAAGALVGEISALSGNPSAETFTAANFVTALKLPFQLYLYFIRKNDLHHEILNLQEKRKFLQESWLFGDAVSYPVQNHIARILQECTCAPPQESRDLCVVREGRVLLYLENDLLETLRPGDFWGEGGVLFGAPCVFEAKVSDGALMYTIPCDQLINMPVIRWKLLEIYHRRMERIFNPSLISRPMFQWHDEYGTCIGDMDQEHKELLSRINDLYDAIFIKKDRDSIQTMINSLIGFARNHFNDEEVLMLKHGYPGYDRHKKKHEQLMNEIAAMQEKVAAGEINIHGGEFVSFIKDWVINHILTTDRNYVPFLDDKGDGLP
ncbi:MAG: bacteriohemerythrin [Desulfobacteraceae bacterium]|nr:bacteriohemerythrin [Desulfobacteraceae bacterium]